MLINSWPSWSTDSGSSAGREKRDTFPDRVRDLGADTATRHRELPNMKQVVQAVK